MGAGLSLLVAGVLALVIVASVVAYQGLPGLDPSRQVSSVRLPDVPPPAREAGDATATAARVSRVRLPDVTRARRSAPRTARQQSAGEYATRTLTVPGGTRASAAPNPVLVEPAAPAPAIDPAPSGREPQLAEDVTRQVQEVLDPVTAATGQTTHAVDKTVGSLLKP